MITSVGSMEQFIPLATDALVKVTALLVLVAVAALLLRRASASLRHMLWTLAIAGMVAIPIFREFVPLRLAVLPARTIAQPAGGGDERDERAPLTLVAGNAGIDKSPQLAEGPSMSDVRRPLSGLPTESIATPFNVSTLLAGIWLFGAILLLGRFVVGLLIVRRLARRAAAVTDSHWCSLADRSARSLGIQTPVELRRSDAIAMPFACGLLKPTIVLPSSSEEWSVDKREAVLMHEMAHVSRGDLTMNALSHVVRALYWFHPLAWLAAYRLRVEGERACDDAVLRAGARPSDYAEHLLSIVRSVGNTVPSVALAMARRSDFEGRLLAILEPGIPRARLTRWRAAGMAALFLLAVMPLAAMAPAGGTNTTAGALVQVTPPLPPTPSRPPTGAIERAPGGQSSEPLTGAVSALIETLADANAAVRLAAVNSLGAIGDPRAIAALAKALKEDTDARVREAAAWALGEIDDTRAVPPLLEALKTERVASVREKIIHALGEIDDPSAVAGIGGALKDPSVDVRRAAVWALGELEDPSAVPSLLAMARDEDAEVRKHTAEALGNLKSVAAIDALALLTRDPNADVRTHAVSALGQLEDRRALPALVAVLKDADAEVRKNAADAIGNMDGLDSAPRALIDALSDVDREVRHNAAHALGHIEDPAAVPALKRATADGDKDVRHAAAEALSEIGGPEAITVLMGLLKDQDPEIRRIAAEALGSKHR